jgi:serpin B
MALSMTMNGAAGTTRTGIIKTLGLKNTEISAVNDYYKLISQQLQSIDKEVVFNSANSIWHKNTIAVLPTFLSVNHNYYNSEVSAIDFSSPSAVKTINNWVKAKTNNEIPTIIKNISPDQVMYLFNAIYFKGLWSNKYDVSKTTDKDFFKENKKVVKCKMMTQEEVDFPIYSNKIFTAIEMSYGHNNFAMTALLPKKGITTFDVISTLTSDSWRNMINRLSYEEVTLNMPRFKMNYETSLNSLLKTMGMIDAFNSKVANFKGINSQGGIYISEIKHKTMINVDEKGTVTAAASEEYTELGIPEMINIKAICICHF